MLSNYRIKQFISFFYPLVLKKYASSISGTLELSLQNGKLVVDSTEANYSYGSLHRVFQKVVEKFTFYSDKKEALILGFGAGSIAKILNEEQNLNLNITGVELDPVMLSIYKKHFAKEANNYNLIQGDVLDFLAHNSRQFDYVFIDVFENLQVPKALLQKGFVENLLKSSSTDSQIAMNTMLPANHEFIKLWMKTFPQASTLHCDEANLVLFNNFIS